MAGVDYYSVQTEIKDILEDNISGAVVSIEDDITTALDDMPKIGIYLADIEVPPEQPLAAGTKLRQLLRFSIWCFASGYTTVADAAKNRDTLYNSVITTLMANATIRDTVTTSWLEGGEFQSARDEATDALFMGAELILVCDITGSL